MSSSLPPATAVAVSGGRGSRRAVSWAAKHLLSGDDDRVLLLHVIAPVSSVPSPSGEDIPIERMEKQVVAMYLQDLKAKAQNDVLLPLKCFCGRKRIEMLVLEGEDVATTLWRYVSEANVKNLVLGSSPFSWFRRIMRHVDVPNSTLQLIPNSCNVFVVAQRRLTARFANVHINNGLHRKPSSISHRSFARWHAHKFRQDSFSISEKSRVGSDIISGVGDSSFNAQHSPPMSLVSPQGSIDDEKKTGDPPPRLRPLCSMPECNLDGKCRRYSISEIEQATDNFSSVRKIGEGSYGDVYKCMLDHTEVAVKVLRKDSDNKKDEFTREVEILSHLHHPHIVLLLGFCPEYGCLVYEYMENRSLDHQLFHNHDTPALPWFVRFRIVFEVACALAFLHNAKPEPIIHRDLKPGNILLDWNFVSKIGDVGLAKLMSDIVPDAQTEYRQTIVAGTMYYMDPEYQRTGTVRPKSDLYALGIITLQLLTGRGPSRLLTDVEKAMEDGTFAQVLDKSVTGWPVDAAEKLANLALRCTKLRCRDRPDLESEVLPELETLLHNVGSSASSNSKRLDFPAPDHFLCPILREVMEDPCVAGDGHTYERRAIQEWLERHNVSPVTKQRLAHTEVVPNHALLSAIREWKSRAITGDLPQP